MIGADLSDGRAIRIGIVGAGQVSQMCHIAPLQKVPHCRIAAIADLRPGLAEAAARLWQIPVCYPDHRRLIDDDTLDAIAVVTNRQATGPVVRDALRSGRPVLAEKPLGHTAEQARLLATCADEAGVPLVVGYMKRHDAGMQAFKRILDDVRTGSAFGALVDVKAWSHAGDSGRPNSGFTMTAEPRPSGLEVWPLAPDWLEAQAASAYASFVNVHIHAVNWLRFLLGSLVVAGAERAAGGHYAVRLMAGEVPVALSCAEETEGDWSEGATLTFALGRLSISLPAPFRDGDTATVSVTADDPALAARFPFSRQPASWAFRRQAGAFVDTVRIGAAPLASGADAVADYVLVEAIWRHLRSE